MGTNTVKKFCILKTIIKNNKNRENGSLKSSKNDYSREEAAEMLKELIDTLDKYRLDRAIETIEEAVLLANNSHWNAGINRLYYACFYATNAALIKHNLSSSKHTGVRSILNREFVKKEIIPKELSQSITTFLNIEKKAIMRIFTMLSLKLPNK